MLELTSFIRCAHLPACVRARFLAGDTGGVWTESGPVIQRSQPLQQRLINAQNCEASPAVTPETTNIMSPLPPATICSVLSCHLQRALMSKRFMSKRSLRAPVQFNALLPHFAEHRSLLPILLAPGASAILKRESERESVCVREREARTHTYWVD